MKTIIYTNQLLIITLLILSSFVISIDAQDGYLGNHLVTVVLSELNATNLAGDIAFLRNQGVSVFTYPLVIQLLQPRAVAGTFQFGVTGPPGVYAIIGSANLTTWNVVGTITNRTGSQSFTDATANLSSRKFYRVSSAF